MMEELLRFWPSQEAVADCIKREAETVHEAVLLAVHQPMRFQVRVVGAPRGQAPIRNEKHLLDAFLSQDIREGTLILPIVGSSGSGKSHAIRWLHAELKRLPDRERRHIIRIPKGSSLKRVLAILLEGLEGPAYEQFRKTLSTARERLDPELAARHLRSFLILEIKRIGQNAAERLKAGKSTDRERDRNRQAFGKMLPGFLDDAEVWAELLGPSCKPPGVIARLAVHVTEEGNSEVDERTHQFAPADFDLESRDIDPANMSKAAREFYRRLTDERRERAAEVVNEALDRAKEQLLNIGDNSLTELFASIRAQLHRDGRELVLLVEDFAVLSGLQGALFDVMVKEAHREGRQELCTLRSALAYTEGYYVPDTVRTRAQSEWAIEERPADDESIVERFCDLAGAYLNAARVGSQEIERSFAQTDGQQDLGDWIPVRDTDDLESEVATACDGFGRAGNGRLLFPLNRAAIRRLAYEGCLDGAGNLEFNPRKLIRNVLDEVLPFRQSFQEGTFPPESVGNRSLQAGEVTETVESMRLGKNRERYRKVLAYWADQPAELADAAALNPSVYEVFGLEPLKFSVEARRGPKPSVTTKKNRVDPAGRHGTVSTPSPAQPHREWDAKLQQWQEGETLVQSDAREIRKAVLEGMWRFVDWDRLLIKPGRKPVSDEVYIPRSKGGAQTTPESAFVCVCSEDELADAAKASRVLRCLKAVVRFHCVYNKAWDYPGGDDDSAAYAAFFQRHAERAAGYVSARYFTSREEDSISFLVAGLAVGGRVLAVEGSAKPGFRALLNHIFRHPAPDLAKSIRADSDRKWDRVRALALEIYAGSDKHRPWRDMLLDQIGARQGGAATVHAIDATVLQPVVEKLAKGWALGEVPLPDPGNSAELKSALATFKELRQRLPKAVSEERQALTSWHTEMTEWLGGGDFSKQGLVDQLGDALKAAKAASLSSKVDYGALKRQIKAFGASAVTTALEDAGRLDGDASPEVTLSILARQDRKTVAVTRELRENLVAMFGELDRNLTEHHKAVGDDPVKAAQQEIRDEFDALTKILTEVEDLQR